MPSFIQNLETDIHQTVIDQHLSMCKYRDLHSLAICVPRVRGVVHFCVYVWYVRVTCESVRACICLFVRVHTARRNSIG